MPADYRLAFRELGLSIGLRAVKRTRELAAQYPGTLDSVSSLGPRLERLMRYAPMIDTIEGFWLEPANRSSRTWKEHEDINVGHARHEPGARGLPRHLTGCEDPLAPHNRCILTAEHSGSSDAECEPLPGRIRRGELH